MKFIRRLQEYLCWPCLRICTRFWSSSHETFTWGVHHMNSTWPSGESSTAAAVRETGSAIGSAIKSYIIFQLKHQQPHLGSSHPLLKNSISAQAGTFSPCSNQDILGCAHTSWLSSQACISYYFLLLPIRPAGRPQAWQIPLFFLDPLTSTVFRSRETVPGSGKALPASSLTATLTLLAKQSCSCCCLTDPSFREPVMHAAYIYSLNLGKEQAIMVR